MHLIASLRTGNKILLNLKIKFSNIYNIYIIYVYIHIYIYIYIYLWHMGTFLRYSLDFSQAGTIYRLGIWTRFFRSVRKYFSVRACIVWKHVLSVVWLLFVRVSVERCFRTYFSFCYLFIFIDYGFLRKQCGISVLVELHVDGMQFYQQ